MRGCGASSQWYITHIILAGRRSLVHVLLAACMRAKGLAEAISTVMSQTEAQYTLNYCAVASAGTCPLSARMD